MSATVLNLVCWNMRCGGNAAAWQTLASFKPDVALLQEARVPQALRDEYDVHERKPFRKTTGHQPWSTAVLVRKSLGIASKTIRFEADQQPWLGEALERSQCCLPVTLDVAGKPLTLVSMYSPAWKLPLAEALTEDQRSHVRLKALTGSQVWQIDLLWGWLKSLSPEMSLVAGGDLNSTPLFDRELGGRWKGNVEVQERMVAIGLEDLVRRVSPDFRQTPTFRNARNKAEYQLDYLYASKSAGAAVSTTHIGDRRLLDDRVSDHLPIRVEVDLARLG